MKFSRLNESLDWVVQPESVEEKVLRAKNIAQTDSTFFQYLTLAVSPKSKIVGLPQGTPDTYKPQYDMPDEVSDTVLKIEYRRVSHFLEDGSVQKLPENKRIALWINILEGLHWKEAEVLTAIKDQNLTEIYPDLTEILRELGLLPQPEEKIVINTTTTTETPVISTTEETTESPIVETTTKKPRKPREKKNAKIEEKSE